VPFLAIVSGQFVILLWKNVILPRLFVIVFVVLIGSYSIFYHIRGIAHFTNDTRKIASEWIEKNLPNESKIEVYSYKFYLPHLRHFNNVATLRPEFIPEYSGQESKILKFFSKNKWIAKSIEDNQNRNNWYDKKVTDNRQLYNVEALSDRSPDYIILSSLYFERYLKSPNSYPRLTKYYTGLLSEDYGYKIVNKFENLFPKVAYVNPTIMILKKFRQH